MNRFYTSIKQSKHLLSLGMNPDTADMFYSRRPTGKSEYNVFPDFKPEGRLEVFTKVDLPCWSSSALLGLISNYIVYHIGNNKTHVTFYSTPRIISMPTHVTKDYDSVIDAAFEMVCWLLENGYIKKGE